MSTWVLLRGLMRESRHWGEFPEALRQEIPDAKAICLDLPGNGSLNDMPSASTVAEMAAWCRSELARRAIGPPFNLLAMSLGAMVAVALAAMHGDEIGRCVLINTSLRPSPFYRRLRPATYPALLKLILLGGGPAEWEATILRLTSNRQAPAVLDDWIAYRREHPVSTRNALRQLLAAARYRAPLTRPEPPLLLLASTGDRLVDPACSRALAGRWGSDIVEHPTAGHDLPLDDGPWVAQQLKLWLVRSASLTRPC